MADSKIVRQLRFHDPRNPQQTTDAPVRAYGSGAHARRPDPSIVPGAPEGPAQPLGPVSQALRTSPNPQNGATQRPQMRNVTPGIGDDAVQVRRSLTAQDVHKQAAGWQAPARAGVAPVVLANGFTTEQRDLLDMLLTGFRGEHESTSGPEGKPGNPELVALVDETRAALARIPTAQVKSAADVSNGPARPRRVEARANPNGNGYGSTNPQGDVKIFAPQTQPFETSRG